MVGADKYFLVGLLESFDLFDDALGHVLDCVELGGVFVGADVFFVEGDEVGESDDILQRHGFLIEGFNRLNYLRRIMLIGNLCHLFVTVVFILY